MKNYVCDLKVLLNEELDRGKKVIFEEAQGTLLDIDHGTYPYATSSNTTIGAVFTSCGIEPKRFPILWEGGNESLYYESWCWCFPNRIIGRRLISLQKEEENTGQQPEEREESVG